MIMEPFFCCLLPKQPWRAWGYVLIGLVPHPDSDPNSDPVHDRDSSDKTLIEQADTDNPMRATGKFQQIQGKGWLPPSKTWLVAVLYTPLWGPGVDGSRSREYCHCSGPGMVAASITPGILGAAVSGGSENGHALGFQVSLSDWGHDRGKKTS